MKKKSEAVAQQYRTWVYPKPIDDLAAAIEQGTYYDFSDPSLFRRKLWPRKIEPDALTILIAGCGSNQAAYYAYRNPESTVWGVDISESSLAHQKYLKDKHRLDNLNLKQLSLEEVGELGQQFDMIVSTGVLHHLPDPDEGLRCLRDVLAPHGVISLMLYGHYKRIGVYMMQQAFQILRMGQTVNEVNEAKSIVQGLPKWHHVRSYIDAANDLDSDAGFVDTFLHPLDRAYTVPQVIEFVTKNGLQFQSWLDNLNYSVAGVIGKASPLYARAKDLPHEKQWELIELVGQALGCHRFLVCHTEKNKKDFTLDFSELHEKAPWLEYKPTFRPPVEILQTAALENAKPARLKRDWQEFELSAIDATLYAACNGQSTVREILLRQPWLADDWDEKLRMGHRFFSQMAELDHLMFEIPATSI